MCLIKNSKKKRTHFIIFEVRKLTDFALSLMITNFSLRFPRNHQPLIGILDASLARWRRTTTTNRKLENKCVAYCRRFAPTRAMLTSNIIILLAMGCLGGACRGLNNTCKRPCVLVCFFFLFCVAAPFVFV